MTGVCPVPTILLDKRVVYAIITSPKSAAGSRMLFFYTKNPEDITLDYSICVDGGIHEYWAERHLLPSVGLLYALFGYRNILLRKRNLLVIWWIPCAKPWRYQTAAKSGIHIYSAMMLLPYSDEPFSFFQSASAQETHFGIGQEIQASIILGSFVEKLETVKK